MANFINWSVNQSNFYTANIPSEATLGGVTGESVLNTKSIKQFRNVDGPSGVVVSMGGKVKSKRSSLRCFLMFFDFTLVHP